MADILKDIAAAKATGFTVTQHGKTWAYNAPDGESGSPFPDETAAWVKAVEHHKTALKTVDVIAEARLSFDGSCTYGVLRWVDAEGFRCHINVHKDGDTWVHSLQQRNFSGPRLPLVHKRQPEGINAATRALNGNTKANAEIVRYVLAQQNAHHLIEDNARDLLARKAKSAADRDAARARHIRAALAGTNDPALTPLQTLSDAQLLILAEAAAVNEAVL